MNMFQQYLRQSLAHASTFLPALMWVLACGCVFAKAEKAHMHNKFAHLWEVRAEPLKYGDSVGCTFSVCGWVSAVLCAQSLAHSLSHMHALLQFLSAIPIHVSPIATRLAILANQPGAQLLDAPCNKDPCFTMGGAWVVNTACVMAPCAHHAPF